MAALCVYLVLENNLPGPVCLLHTVGLLDTYSRGVPYSRVGTYLALTENPLVTDILDLSYSSFWSLPEASSSLQYGGGLMRINLAQI